MITIDNIKTIVIGLLILVILSFSYCEYNKRQFAENKVTMYENSMDSITKIKNKDGTETSTTSLLEGDIKMLLSLKTLDSSLKSLQDIVKNNKNLLKNGGSVTVYSNTTIYNNSSPTILDTSQQYPIYYGSSKDTTWIKWKTRASKDSTQLSLFVKNAYSVILGNERYGFLKLKSKPIVLINNQNPYTSTEALKAFQISKKPNRFNISLQGGYGLTLKGFSPYLGLGIGYKLIEF